jgi:hypothetical protein
MVLHARRERKEYNWFCMQGGKGKNTIGSACSKVGIQNKQVALEKIFAKKAPFYAYTHI